MQTTITTPGQYDKRRSLDMKYKEKAKEKAALQDGSNQMNFYDEHQTVSSLQNAINSGELQEKLVTHLAQHRRIYRLFRCEGCGHYRTLRKMSISLILCRCCVINLRKKGKLAASNFISRTVNKFHQRLRLEVR